MPWCGDDIVTKATLMRDTYSREAGEKGCMNPLSSRTAFEAHKPGW